MELLAGERHHRLTVGKTPLAVDDAPVGATPAFTACLTLAAHIPLP